MRLAFRVAWRSVSQSRHRVPFVVGSPQPMQGRGMGMVHLRSRCLCIRSSGIANGVLLGRRGGRIGGRSVMGVGSLQEVVFVSRCFRYRGDPGGLLEAFADDVAVVGV